MDNAFEKARAAYGTGAYDDATLEFLFPQLKESEDERIRKWLVNYFTEIGENWIHREFTCEQIIAYLEKQKDHFRDDTKMVEQKPAEVDESTKRLNDNWMKQRFDDYEEQKPAEWSEEDEKKIHFLSRLIEFQVKDDEYCFGDGSLISKQEAIEMLKSLRPSWKPSEEQMKEYSYWYRNFIESGLASPTSKAVTVLGELLEQLKKLI